MAFPFFGTVLTPDPFASGANNTTLSLALGATTLVRMTSVGGIGLDFIGLEATGGNIDGMVVCMANVNGTSTEFRFVHESLSASAANRFRTAGQATFGGGNGYGAVWFRYHGTLQRWITIGSTL